MSHLAAQSEVRDWKLERYLLGELPPSQTFALWEALERDRTLRRRLDELERHGTELLAHHPPRVVAAQVRERLGQAAPAAARSLPRWMPSFALGAVVMACLALQPPSNPLPPEPDTRIKGLSPQLLLFRKAPSSEVERLLPGTSARHHDLVQLAYQAAGRRYGVIVSIDGRGLVTRHLPPAGAQAVPLKAGLPVLPQAYELDDAPAFERFYLVAADAPFPVERVVAAVRRRHGRPDPAAGEPAALDLPPSMVQSTFVLRKEPAR
jgi:hypothetical protein